MRTATFKSLVSRVFLMTAMVAATAGTAAAQEILTIQEAIERTLKNNLTIKQTGLNVSRAEVDLLQSRAALYPSLNGGINQNMNWGRSQQASGVFENTQNYQASGSLSTSLDVFGGFAKINTIKQNRLLLDAGRSNLEKAKNDLILQVMTAYFQIVFNTELLKSTEQQLAVAKQTLQREQALLDAGNKTLADISQAKAQVATAELNRTDAENALTISYLTLNQLMEIRPEDVKPFSVKAPTAEEIIQNVNLQSVDEVYKTTVNVFPDVKVAEFNRLAAEKGIDVARGAIFPRISLNAGLGSLYFYRFNLPVDFSNPDFNSQLRDNFGQNVGLSIQIPVFNGLQVRSSVKRAKISYENAKIEEQWTKNNLNKVVSQAIADQRAAISRYSSTQNTLKAQQDAFNVIEQRYNVGLVNSLDYNISRTNRNNAEIDFIRAKYDLLFRAKVIDYYLGKQITF
ncbi:TolC family protein [Pedobacter sp. SYP-B3415]|uniref:TolC family protein n=1 Tax=Pedobacter sp. SYP-B3415 TaxID=2496641 RepID=UPI00101C68E4|nr:TolC family protein [Pedobacter sp. SYP-B3415]